MPLDVNLNYADMVLRLTTQRAGGQRGMVSWMREKDLHTRGIMVELMRSGMSQGEALTQSLKESEVYWTTGRQGEGDKECLKLR